MRRIGPVPGPAALLMALAAGCTQGEERPVLPLDIGTLKAVDPFLPGTRTRKHVAACDVSEMVTVADAPWTLRTTLLDCPSTTTVKTRVELEDSASGTTQKVFDLDEARTENVSTTLQFAPAPHGGVPDLYVLDASCTSPSGAGCEIGWIYRFDAKASTYRAYFAYGHVKMWRSDEHLLTRSGDLGGKVQYQIFTARQRPPSADGDDRAIHWHNGLLALIDFEPATGACQAQVRRGEAMTALEAVPAPLQRLCTSDFR